MEVELDHVLTVLFFHNWFDFVLSSEYHVVSLFLTKLCLHTKNNWMKNWKVKF